MPLYEYVCTDCGQFAEILIRGQEQPLCPACSSSRLEKQLSVPAAHSRETGNLPMMPPGGPCGMGGCGRPECE